MSFKMRQKRVTWIAQQSSYLICFMVVIYVESATAMLWAFSTHGTQPFLRSIHFFELLNRNSVLVSQADSEINSVALFWAERCPFGLDSKIEFLFVLLVPILICRFFPFSKFSVGGLFKTTFGIERFRVRLAKLIVSLKCFKVISGAATPILYILKLFLFVLQIVKSALFGSVFLGPFSHLDSHMGPSRDSCILTQLKELN